jgi:hypothetical protein
VIVVVGVGGMITRNRTAARTASLSLIGLVVWSKTASDIYKLPGPDTAVLLLQFLTTVFLMEASTITITFREEFSLLSKMNDKVSEAAQAQLSGWVVGQVAHLGELTIGAFLLSLGLLVLGGLIGITVDQLAITGIMVLAAIVAILILLTYRREPESPRTQPVSVSYCS